MLYKVMVVAAMADGRLSQEEQALIDRTFHDLELNGEYVAEAQAFRECPQSIVMELNRIDSYRMRLAMFRHGVGVAHADGRLTLFERFHLRRLASALHLRRQDVDQIKRSFSSVPRNATSEDLIQHISPARDATAPPAGDEQYRTIGRRPDEIRQAAAQREAQLALARERFQETGPVWAEFLARCLAQALVNTTIERFEGYGALKDPELDDLLSALDPEAMVNEVNEVLPQLYEAARSRIKNLETGISPPPEVYHEFDGVWERIVHDDGGWERAANHLV